MTDTGTYERQRRIHSGNAMRERMAIGVKRSAKFTGPIPMTPPGSSCCSCLGHRPDGCGDHRRRDDVPAIGQYEHADERERTRAGTDEHVPPALGPRDEECPEYGGHCELNAPLVWITYEARRQRAERCSDDRAGPGDSSDPAIENPVVLTLRESDICHERLVRRGVGEHGAAERRRLPEMVDGLALKRT